MQILHFPCRYDTRITVRTNAPKWNSTLDDSVGTLRWIRHNVSLVRENHLQDYIQNSTTFPRSTIAFKRRHRCLPFQFVEIAPLQMSQHQEQQ